MTAITRERNHHGEIFPILARFAQEIRSPLTFISVQLVESAAENKVRLVEVSTLSISRTGASSWACYFADASSLNHNTVPGAGIRRSVGLRESREAVSFSVLYEHISKAFLGTLVIGFGSGRTDLPVLLKLMNAASAPTVRPKAHLDIQNAWWQIQKAEVGEFSAAGAMYNVSVGQNPRGDDAVLATAKIYEAMLWRHGYEVLVKNIEINDYPYVPMSESKVSKDLPLTRTAMESRSRKNEAELRELLLEILKPNALEQEKAFSIPCLAKELGVSSTKASIALGQLIARGRIKYLPFLDHDAQEVLDAYLPAAITLHGYQKLKPLKEHVEEKSGEAVDYIQLRIALLKRNLKLN